METLQYLNGQLPGDARIRLLSWDMARCAKSREGKVLHRLDTIACSILKVRAHLAQHTTGYAHHGLCTPWVMCANAFGAPAHTCESSAL